MRDLQLFSGQDYVDILKQVLEQKKTKNDRYSLRAMARDLGLAPSRLSNVLNRKSHLSPRSATVICERLNWDRLESEYFVSLVKARTVKTPDQRWEALKQVRAIRLKKAYQIINVELLKKMNWKHFAVRFLVTTEINHHQNPEIIAQKIGVDPEELKQIITDLCQLGLLYENHDGRLMCEDRLRIGDDSPSRSVQTFHRSMLEKAMTSLSEEDLERRFFRSSIFTLNREQYRLLQTMIVDFVSACSDLDESQDVPHDDVYALSVQLFPLTVL
ncbi:MAG: TIGR02147 family protein [Oligoflexus sp.]